MSCDLTKGRGIIPCKDVIGGIKAVYFSVGNVEQYEDGSFTLANGILSDFSNGNNWFKYAVLGGNSFTQTGIADPKTGSKYYETELTVVLPKQTMEIQLELDKMAQNPELWVMIEDNNGAFFMMGLEKGVIASVGSESGTELGDLTGFKLSLKATEKDMMPNAPAFIAEATIIS